MGIELSFINSFLFSELAGSDLHICIVSMKNVQPPNTYIGLPHVADVHTLLPVSVEMMGESRPVL